MKADQPKNGWSRGCQIMERSMKVDQLKNGWSRDDKDRESEDTSCYNGCGCLVISARESVEKMCMIKSYLGNEQSRI